MAIDGLRLIAEEVRHQRDSWDLEHDITQHGSARLMVAASIILDGGYTVKLEESIVPWAVELWRKHHMNPARRAMIAGALCAAAIDVATFEAGRKAITRKD